MATVTILNLPATNTVDATTVAPVVYSGTTYKATLSTLGAFINTNAVAVTASGNIAGGNLLTNGLISAAGNVTGSYLFGNGSQLTGLAATYGNANVVANLAALGSNPVSTTGNITGGNLITSAAISAASVSVSGNITGGNILGGANVNATTHTGTTVNVSGNIDGGNLNAAGLSLSSNVVSALNVTGAIAGANVTTPGLISATGNITGGNILGGANVNATTHTGTTVSVTGNITGGNIITSAAVSAASVSASGNITGANVNVGNITIATDLISSANSVITIDPATSGNAGLVVINGNLQVNGNTTTINSNVVSTNDLTVNYANNAINGAAANGGGIEVGPIGSPFITWLYNDSANVWTSSGGISAVGNITGGNISATNHTGTTVSVSGNITGGNLTVSTGNITGGNIVNAGSNGVGNIGNATVGFNTVFAKSTSAQYADLAEKYTADAEYTSGTVLSFGGAQEVTVTLIDADHRVAGVISTNPATIMNAGLASEHVATVALTGRVPCSVTGTVRKGDSMVSAGNGVARAEANPAVSTVIGKSLEDFDGESGMIEIVVGRV